MPNGINKTFNELDLKVQKRKNILLKNIYKI